MKPITKKIITIGVFLAVVATITVTIILLTQETPESLNSYGIRFVYADEYDASIEDYEVGAFETYEEFSKSKWANAKVDGHDESLKDSYYTDRYFKEKNLVIIAFNQEYRYLHFEIVDEKTVGDRCDLSAVVLYDVPRSPIVPNEDGYVVRFENDEIHSYLPEDVPKNYVGTHEVSNSKGNTTYYYLYETEESLAKEYTFTIVAEHFYGCDSQIYARNSFEAVLMPDEETPVTYRFGSKAEADVFVAEDPYFKRFLSAVVILKANVQNGIDEHDVILVRFPAPANDVFWQQGAYLEGTELLLWNFDSNEKSLLKGEASYVVIFTVPKGATIETLRWVSYRGENSEPRIEENVYNLVRDDSSTIEKYKTEIRA